MAVPRVLVLYRHSILTQGLLWLLREQAGLQVRAWRFDAGSVQEAVRDFEPDVIIIDRDDLGADSPVTIDQLLRGRPHARVVALSSRDELGRVYEGHEVTVAKLEDLLATLANRNPVT